jgi:hypothetical protein
MTLLIVADKVRDDTGILYASERRVAGEWLGRSQSTYRKWRSDLIRLGLMSRQGQPRDGVACKYLVLPDADTTAQRGESPRPPMTTDAIQRIQAAKSAHGSEQNRAQARAVEPHGTSPHINEERVSKGPGVFDDAMRNLALAEIEFEEAG